MSQTDIKEITLNQFRVALNTIEFEALKKIGSSILENIGKGLSLI